ncbi:Threonine dehydrogenase and related Zn-dependent dehydrogenase [Rubrobacter radiotolerans]|uniref:Threonine dehydrogenase and related Zn-dependent dehydrogenase n=1 Tax=Rubrobacter radiotolerans TaxID=42256 RepID=A0A023X532_RUBRA|nr:zinc-binding dehydrogenase [Rubrobacter radiotolerans]AHY47179.1 Threonine dehydrogenase and related Zn-dependent dehydrogenase [Rubrobacter radiotolerans]MDX5894582.1 zinc-binding dehydrogenase [Rubrobacter radiotolerans]SMC06318.1 Threonine dehydrogenase [Rubrobacter radiotolerans DSM 5868]
MRSLVYRKSVPKYLLMRFASKRARGVETGRFSPLQLESVGEPPLPTPEWVRVRPRVSGICGSDLGTLLSENSPYFSPITSPPFTMGHEIVGTVTEDNSGFAAGERVVVEPALGCRVRGIEPPCEPCARGDYALCVNTTRGDLAPGIQTGFCNSTGGGWTEGTLVAHPAQLHRVPQGLSDEAAVVVEPLACAVHAALSAGISPGDTAVVIGAGSVGLLTVAALSHLTEAGRVICVAKHERQRREALRLGASEVVTPAETYTRLPGMLGTQAMKPELGKPVVPGGARAVFDCVGSAGTLEDAVRLTEPGGRCVLVGMPGQRTSLDLTALWHKEVNLAGAYAYGVEEHRGERTTSFALALALAEEIEAGRLVGPLYRLSDYREAIKAARSTGRAGNVKVAFDLR